MLKRIDERLSLRTCNRKKGKTKKILFPMSRKGRHTLVKSKALEMKEEESFPMNINVCIILNKQLIT